MLQHMLSKFKAPSASSPQPTAKYHEIDTDSESGDSLPAEKRGMLGKFRWHNNIGINHETRAKGTSLPRLKTIIPWALSAILGALSLVLHLRFQQVSTPWGTYEAGYSTDFSLGAKVPLEPVRFTGSPHFFPNSTPWLPPIDETAPWPNNVHYFGEPSPQLDENWDRYIGQRYFSISKEEATEVFGDRLDDFVDEAFGGYTAGLDIFHTLHCVNTVRKALRPDYYDDVAKRGTGHVEHCLEIIRQSVQCYGSTTLIPTFFREELGDNYIDSDQVHICRSFQFLRDYTTSRAKGHENYIPRDKSVVHGKVPLLEDDGLGL